MHLAPAVKPLRIAFVGAGHMARLHLHALRRVATPHRVVGVYDKDDAASHQLSKLANATSYPTLAELLSSAEPNVVHICTSAGSHFEPAWEALQAGAHVYVEKPFADTLQETEELLAIAERRRLLVCAGHQQLRDPAYVRLLEGVRNVGEVIQVDSHLTFRPVGSSGERAGAQVLAAQLVDVLPHPLYTLVDALHRTGTDLTPLELASVVAGPADLHAVIRANGRYGRLSVSLRARPIASLVSVSASGGMLTADFLRSTVVGAANPGVTPVEKAANPLVESCQLALRSATGVARRILSGDYPGLAELIGDFYAAVAASRTGATSVASPVSPDHLRYVTRLFEELAANVRSAARTSAQTRRSLIATALSDAPLVVVTGARGFFGKAITKQLARRGYRVRGISRSIDESDPHVHEWRRLDLSRSAPADAFAGAEAVVHAAAASSGDYDTHQRHTLEATRNVLHGLQAAGVSRLVHVSSLSVLRPPRTPWEQQDENTPLTDERPFGAYVWGKSNQERIVTSEAPRFGITTRIIRPGALVDWSNPETPGIMARRLFGAWHLGFGRPALPLPVCDVGTAATVVGWTVAQFADAPPVLNLVDPSLPSRRCLIEEFRRRGWRGRFVWVPIPLFAILVHAARYALALPRLRRPKPLALYGILRPRRYSYALSEQVLRNAMRDAGRAAPALAAQPA